MTDKLKDFLEYASNNEELKNKVNDLNAQSKDKDALIKAAIAIAKENGFELAKDDFKEEPQELTDDELDNVAGGTYYGQGSGRTSNCWCSVGGGGTGDQYQKTCACVASGVGELTDYGKEQARAHTISYRGGDSAPVAMYCPFIGWG